MTSSIERTSSDYGELSFRVEKLRLLGYISFWVVVIAGVFLTRVYSHVDLEHTILTEVFGYNNICIYFDHPPATYFLPTLWAITLVLLMSYMGAAWLRMRVEVLAGTLKPHLYRVLSGFKIFEAFTLVSVSTVFAGRRALV